MSAIGNTGDGKIYINTFQGKFSIKANEGQEGSTTRTNKSGKVVHEIHFNTLKDVVLEGIQKRISEEYGDNWEIFLADNNSDERYCLNLPYSGRVPNGLLLRLPELELDKPFTLRIYWHQEDERASLVAYQHGEKLPYHWTKEEPKGLPDLEKIMVNGKETWDSTKRMAYLESYIAEQVNPKLNTLESNTVMKEPVLSEREKEANNVVKKESGVIYDEDAQCLKKKHTDDNWYECDTSGKFLRDQKGEMISVLPF